MPRTVPGRPRVTADSVRRLFNYDPSTGVVTWKSAPGAFQLRYIGRVAGTINKKGYRTVTIGSRVYQLHRVIWLYVHGVWPKATIDHANCDPLDNRLCNLREATRSQNQANRRLVRAAKSGFRGVFYYASRESPKKWRAQIQSAGGPKLIGYFVTGEEASAAYRAAVQSQFGEFARL